ncbi:glyoxalase superfamily protein [Sphingobium sp. B2D3C]|uniref:glyoxalase superfamily protein n=1 Tax=Sphingobium sp. B2D3C TaxID=2940581 RepID=UPI0022252A17|nr:glyoxalase superfamily protein [Sphingobium sp. B2D3C]MCW2397912.1 AcrR family transcriptional regulator/catechol 2,3-dioxygenase-like lactoylglutathione lyase family enzyme [Sphingobium sp. B2D3C]
MKPPRTKPSEIRREDILGAAAALFLEKGISATTIEQIATKAGVAKGTFYLYFQSKEDVLAGLRANYIARFVTEIEAKVEAVSPDDWWGRLRAWSSAMVDGYLEDVPLHDIVFHEPPTAARSPSGDNPVTDSLTRLISSGSRAGAWEVPEPDITSAFIFHGVHGLIDGAILRGDLAHRKGIVSRAEALCASIMGRPRSADADRFAQAIPIVRIFDVAAAYAFYCDYLGFSVDWEHRFAPSAPLYAQVSREGLRLHLSEHSGDATPGGNMVVAVRGLVDFLKELEGRPYRNLSPAIEDDGERQTLEVIDPFNNHIRFMESAVV